MAQDAPFTPFWMGDHPNSWWIKIFGVLFPAFTLAFELATGFCAEFLFDPVPTIWHMLLVALVPVFFLLVQFADSKHLGRVAPLLPTLAGCAVAVCLVFSAPFVRLLPVWILGLIIYGGGLLPMAPLLACAACVTLAWRLRREPRWRPHFGRRLGGGFVVGMMLFVVVEARVIVTHVGIEMASASHAQARGWGIRLLRGWGSDEEMRRLSSPAVLPGQSERPTPRSILERTLWRVDAVEVQDVYYRATGRLWNAVPPTERRTFLGRKRWTWADNQSGEVFGPGSEEPAAGGLAAAGGGR